jgi:hypothetical protein
MPSRYQQCTRDAESDLSNNLFNATLEKTVETLCTGIYQVYFSYDLNLSNSLADYQI